MTTSRYSNMKNSAAGIIDLNIKSMIKESWHKVYGFKATCLKAFFLAFVLTLLLDVLLVVPTMAFSWHVGEGSFVSTLLSIEGFISTTISTLFSVSLSYIAINYIAGKPVNAKMIFIFFKRFKELILLAVFIELLKLPIFHLFNSIKLYSYSINLPIEIILLIIGILVFW